MLRWTRGFRILTLLAIHPLWTFLVTGRYIADVRGVEQGIVALLTVAIVVVALTGAAALERR